MNFSHTYEGTDAQSVDYKVSLCARCLEEEPICGDNVVNRTEEECDGTDDEACPGECQEDCTCPDLGDEGCTPGYWKQEQHFDSWPTDYDPRVYVVTFYDVFEKTITIMWSEKGKPFPVENPTLLQALEANGGGDSELARHGVAALLSALNPDVAYPLSAAEVIAEVQAEYPDTAKLVRYNELGCPLNNDMVMYDKMSGDSASTAQAKVSAGCASIGGPTAANVKDINLQLLVLAFGLVMYLKGVPRRK